MKVCNRSFLDFSFITSKGKQVIIQGKHRSSVIGAEYYIQDINDADWKDIAIKYKDLCELKNNIIFAHESENEVKSKAKDFIKQKVGDEKALPLDRIKEDE